MLGACLSLGCGCACLWRLSRARQQSLQRLCLLTVLRRWVTFRGRGELGPLDVAGLGGHDVSAGMLALQLASKPCQGLFVAAAQRAQRWLGGVAGYASSSQEQR